MIPTETRYDKLPPMGYPNSIRIMTFQPNNNGNSSPGDIVRFNINSPGFWDPYSAYINVEIDLSQEASLDYFDALQIDGSASSLISELVVTCKGGELERVSEYDVIASIIEDTSLNNAQRQCRDIQGLGSNNRVFNKPIGSSYTPGTFGPGWTTPTTAPVADWTKLNWYQSKPWMENRHGNGYSVATDTVADITGNLTTSFRKKTYGSISTLGSSAGSGGLVKNTLDNLAMGFSTGGFDNSTTTGNDNANCNIIGIPNIFNQDLTEGCFEPVLSKGVSMPTMLNGSFNTTTACKRNFCIPIYSGIFGILMPKNSYKYIPMNALEDLVLEFRLNPYALFAAGYRQASGQTESATWLTIGTDLNSKYGQIPRKWKISKFEIVVEMLFFDKIIDQMIIDQINSDSGVVFHTTSWYLGPLYNIPAGTTPSGTYQLNLGFESLKTLVLAFIPQDYLKYTFLRKLYRVNCSITSLQLRVGMDLFPSLPIKGHAGTSGHYDSTYGYKNNAEYLIALQKAFGKFQNKDEDFAVNQTNFAVNERYWNYTTDDVKTTVNNHMQTTGYMPLIHENRCKGKALFAMDLESLSENKNVISGLNTIRNRPFEILLTSDAAYPYGYRDKTYALTQTASVTMMIFCQYDMIVQLRKWNVSVVGRGSGI